MPTLSIPKELKDELVRFLKKNRKADLSTTYLFYLEERYDVHPVIYLREKTIYQDRRALLRKLEEQGKLWRETEIKIQVGQPSVNELTKKIYICPFTGKVFGDNTCANPQDAIYEWVSRCPENTERVGGLRVKRFFVSEDPEVIKNYITKRREPITKIVFSSVVTGKLFNSKESVIEDFVKNQLKTMSLLEVTNQNRYQIEESFLAFIQTHFADAQINAFVEALSSIDELSAFVEEWLEGEKKGG